MDAVSKKNFTALNGKLNEQDSIIRKQGLSIAELTASIQSLVNAQNAQAKKIQMIAAGQFTGKFGSGPTT